MMNQNSDCDGIQSSPAKYFRFAVRETRERIRICESLSSNMEELAEIESIYGKSLVKIGSQSHSPIKSELPLGVSNCWDLVFSMSERVGKQHIGFSVCISQSVGRTFANFADDNKKKVHDIVVNIQMLADELRKCRKLYKKEYEKYILMAQEADSTLKAKYMAVKDGNRLNEQTDDNFINRSLTMMLGKLHPGEGIKRLQERSRDLLRDIDAQEAFLMDTSMRVNILRENLGEELHRAVIQLEEIEKSRLNFVKEGLARFCQSSEGMLDHIDVLLGDLRQNTTQALRPQAEVDALQVLLAKPVSVSESAKWREMVSMPELDQDLGSLPTTGGAVASPPAASSAGADPPIDPAAVEHAHAEAAVDMADLFTRVDQMRLYLDYVRDTTQRSANVVMELADMERNYCKATNRVFEKYGYLRSSGRAVTSSNAAASVAGAELVGAIEAPLMKQGWDAIIKSFSNFSESHAHSVSVYTDRCCPTADAVQKRIEILKKELIDKQLSAAKKLDVARASLSRLYLKLSRIKRELKDRRGAVRVGEGESGTVPHLDGGLADTALDANEANLSTTERELNRVLQALQLNSLESFGSAIGVAVGLESNQERCQRIENRIVNLEEEQVACLESLASMKLSIQSVQKETSQDISAAIDALKVSLLKELGGIKIIFKALQDSVSQSLNICRKAVADVRNIVNRMDIESDFHFFVKVIHSAANSPSPEDTRLAQELPPPIAFSPYESELIDRERPKDRSLIETQERGTAPQSVIMTAKGTASETIADVTPKNVRSGRSQSVASVTSRNTEGKDHSGTVSTSTVTVPSSLKSNTSLSKTLPSSIPDATQDGREVEMEPMSIDQVPDAVRTSSTAPADESPTSLASTQAVQSSPLPREPSSPISPSRTLLSSSPNGTKVVTPNRNLDSGMSLRTPSNDDSDSSEVKLDDGKKRILIGRVDLSLESDGGDDDDEDDEEEEEDENEEDDVDEKHTLNFVAAIPTADIAEDRNVSVEVADASSLSRTKEAWVDSPLHKRMTASSAPSRAKVSGLGQVGGEKEVVASNKSISGNSTMEVMEPLYAAAASVGIVLPWTADKHSSSENPFAQELAKFSLPSTEKVVEFFSCALYPKKGMLTHGRLFLTPQYLAFSGWPEGRVLLSLQQIADVERTTLFFVPNALLVTTAVGEEYFFGSFLDRDLCFNMLTMMVKIAKRLVEMEFYSDHGSGENASAIGGTEMSAHAHAHAHAGLSPRHSAKTQFKGLDEDDGIDLSALFTKSSVAPLAETRLPFSIADVWRFSWHLTEGYKAFLTGEGDFDIVSTDWEAFNGKVSEDICKLPYSFSRSFKYLHPRTSMLMFGPKNATAYQTQFLYLASPLVKAINDNVSTNQASVVQSMFGFFPQKFVVLTLTEFVGIPMSDTFKILQYWSFGTTGSALEPAGGQVRIGCAVHFIKPTMLKAQISSGTESELTVLSKKWCGFMKTLIGEKLLLERSVATGDSEMRSNSSGHGGASAGIIAVADGILDGPTTLGLETELNFQTVQVSDSNVKGFDLFGILKYCAIAILVALLFYQFYIISDLYRKLNLIESIIQSQENLSKRHAEQVASVEKSLEMLLKKTL